MASGKRVLGRGTALSRRGRFHARVRLRGRPAKRILLTVRYAGDRVTAPLVLKRLVPLRRRAA